jgi:YVTN family beta-propeller protein
MRHGLLETHYVIEHLDPGPIGVIGRGWSVPFVVVSLFSRNVEAAAYPPDLETWSGANTFSWSQLFDVTRILPCDAHFAFGQSLTATTAVSATVAVGSNPIGVADKPDGSKVYVANKGRHSTVSVIDTATDSVSTTIDVGLTPIGVAVTPDGSRVYLANDAVNGTVSVIVTATNAVSATVAVGRHPFGIAVKPDGSKVYVANRGNGTVSVIDATNKVVATIDVGLAPHGLAVTSDGSKVYVANLNNCVSVIDTATNAVSATTRYDSRRSISSMGRIISHTMRLRGIKSSSVQAL